MTYLPTREDCLYLAASLSRTANCYNKAAMESFWAILNAECFGTTIPTTRN